MSKQTEDLLSISLNPEHRKLVALAISKIYEVSTGKNKDEKSEDFKNLTKKTHDIIKEWIDTPGILKNNNNKIKISRPQLNVLVKLQTRMRFVLVFLH